MPLSVSWCFSFCCTHSSHYTRVRVTFRCDLQVAQMLCNWDHIQRFPFDFFHRFTMHRCIGSSRWLSVCAQVRRSKLPAVVFTVLFCDVYLRTDFEYKLMLNRPGNHVGIICSCFFRMLVNISLPEAFEWAAGCCFFFLVFFKVVFLNAVLTFYGPVRFLFSPFKSLK